MGKRISFVFAYSLALAGGILIFLLESDFYYLPPSFLDQFQGNLIHRRSAAVDFLVPKLIFFTKLGMFLSFLCTY